ncbi:MAG: HWE histidine kinase domain-containing protein [Hyphomicrobiales bacterium]|nr:HWE histidine kinase domain-containing protein [Hyphomicrobiales bacterium]
MTGFVGVSLLFNAFAIDVMQDAAGQMVGISIFLLSVSAAVAALLQAPQALIEYRINADMRDLRVTADVLSGAISKSPITVFSQDKDLRYTFTHNLPEGFQPDILGKTDADILTPETAAKTIPLKRAATERGEIGRVEIPMENNGRQRWYDMTVEQFHDAKGDVGSVSIAYDITQIRENKEKLILLMREVTHRSKNLLAVAQSIAQQTATRGGTVEEYVRRFSGRLKALGDAQDMLVKHEWTGALVEDLLASQLSMLPAGRRANVVISGHSILVNPKAAQNLCLVFHELVANAADYGALSTSEGRLHVKWEVRGRAGGSELCFQWLESGGPIVTSPTKSGFGCLMIETVLSSALNAQSWLAFPVSGVECKIHIPATAFA